MGCLLRYRDGLSSPICQFKNTADGPQQKHTDPAVESGYGTEGFPASLSSTPAVWD